MSDLSSPAELMARLEAIEQDLAYRQNAYERATERWFRALREQKRQEALSIVSSHEGTVTERKARGTLVAYDVEDAATEAEHEGLKAVIRVLEQRGMILMALLKSHGRL